MVGPSPLKRVTDRVVVRSLPGLERTHAPAPPRPTPCPRASDACELSSLSSPTQIRSNSIWSHGPNHGHAIEVDPEAAAKGAFAVTLALSIYMLINSICS